MNKSRAPRTELPLQLAYVLFHCRRIRVDQRVEAKYEIERAISDHVERASVVREIRNILAIRKPLLTVLDAGGRKIHNNQMLAVIQEELRPAAMPRGNFEDCRARKKLADSRQEKMVPVCFGPAPPLRPFIALFGPCVFLIPLAKVVFNCVRRQRHRTFTLTSRKIVTYTLALVNGPSVPEARAIRENRWRISGSFKGSVRNIAN